MNLGIDMDGTDTRAPVVEVVRQVTPAVAGAMALLLPQLTAAGGSLDQTALAEIIAGPATTLLLASDAEGGTILGSVTLVLFRIPSGLRARIESLVVDASARRRGVGRALCQAAIALARQRGAATVDLTSGPTRAAARALYQQLGFTQRDSATFRLALSDDPAGSQGDG